MENFSWNMHPPRARGEELQKMFFDPQDMAAKPVLHQKACIQCGATETPQWRGSADGPKTLCNACGVKYCRQKKKASGGKLKSAARQSHPAVLTEQAPRRQEPAPALLFHKYTEDLAEWENHARPRTQRKAAKDAMSKTAKYAASGEWPDDYGNDSAFPQHRPSSDAVLGSTYSPDSDFAEELYASPEKLSHAMEVHVGRPVGFCRRPASPIFARQTEETADAVDSLLCLAWGPEQSEDQLQAGPLQPQGPSDVPSSPADLAVEEQLKLIKDDLDRTLLDMHLAEAVAAAAAEVLAQAQSVANRARERHQQVLKRMHDLTATRVQNEEDEMPQPSKIRRVSC